MLEHGAYTLLLDRYYATEQGVSADQAHRIARARSKEEKAAVDAVLYEFFALVDGAWLNGRADREIARFHEGDDDREAKKANATERQRRTRERRKLMFDQLRSHGIVPAWDASTNELEKVLSRVTGGKNTEQSQPVTPPVTRDATATQTPDTRHQQEQEQNPPVSPQGGSKRQKSLTLADYLGDCQRQAIEPIPHDDAVWGYPESMGFPVAWVDLAWWAFQGRHLAAPGDKAKRQASWRQAFRNAVRENWLHLWWTDGAGYRLTTAGVQAQREMERAA